MEFDSMMEVKNIGERIGNFPALGQRGPDVEVLVTIEKVIKDEAIDALGVRVKADAGIEIRRTAFDDHDERVGIGVARAGQHGRATEQGEHERYETREGTRALAIRMKPGSSEEGITHK
jgi:hypothetical protein